MGVSRRSFLKWTAAVSASGVVRQARAGDAPSGFRPNLLPSQKDVWAHQVWMAKVGPKYTGSAAHTTFVEFLAKEFSNTGCNVVRDRYTLPRWEARRREITIAPASGAAFKAPVTSVLSVSGETPASGVTGALASAGSSPTFALDDLGGKVALDFATATREWARIYKPWGIHPASEAFRMHSQLEVFAPLLHGLVVAP